MQKSARGRCPEALKTGKAPGAHPRLDNRQQKLLAAGPEAAGFRGQLWTCPRIGKLIQQKFGVRTMSDTISSTRRRSRLYAEFLPEQSVYQDDLIAHFRRLRRMLRTPPVIVLDNLKQHEAKRLRAWYKSIATSIWNTVRPMPRNSIPQKESGDMASVSRLWATWARITLSLNTLLKKRLTRPINNICFVASSVAQN